MTETPTSDERLAAAFRATVDGPEAVLPESDVERIWLAVSGALPAEERRAVVAQTAVSAVHAEAWRVAHELWQASQARTPATADAQPPGRTRRWTIQWISAAAVLLVGTTLGLVTLRTPPQSDAFRSSPGYAVHSRVADDARLPRAAFRLRWAPGPDGSRYRIRVTTDDLTVLAMAADLDTPEFLVPARSLSHLPGGAIVLWQVDAYLPDGERVTSRTFVTHVE